MLPASMGRPLPAMWPCAQDVSSNNYDLKIKMLVLYWRYNVLIKRFRLRVGLQEMLLAGIHSFIIVRYDLRLSAVCPLINVAHVSVSDSQYFSTGRTVFRLFFSPYRQRSSG